MPVALGLEGSYVTATHQPGRVAVWSPEGRLSRVIGNGEGEGPGEFQHVSGLVVDNDSVVNIITGLQHWHRYTWEGGFIETIRVPSVGGLSEATIAPGGTLVTTTMGPEGIGRLVLWRPGTRVRVVDGSFAAVGAHALISASREMGLWSAEHTRYAVRRHSLPSGTVDFEIERTVEWFPSRSGGREYRESAPLLFRLTVDDRRLLWVWTNVADPDAPSTPRPPVPFPGEEDPDVASRYRDYVLEVLSADGRLVASRRFDRVQDVAVGVTADFWVRTGDDPLRTLTILRPILVER